MTGCRGWRLGLVGGGGSAGSVLRSQGTLGPVGLSRGRARGGQGVDVPMLAAARSRCRPGRPPGSVTLPKADSSQRVGTGFLAAFLSARGFVGIGDLDPQLGPAS